MTVLVTVLEFVGVCLLLGLGLSLAVEGAGQLHQRRLVASLRDVMVALGGLVVVAAAGGYWISMAIP